MAFSNPYSPYGGYFNPQYPAMPYQAQSQFQPTQPAQQPQGGGINWVQGESGAKAFTLAPGQSAMLMDSECQRFYIKSVDPSGMPSLRIFDFTERTAQPQQPKTDTAEFVTRQEFAALQAAVEAMKGGVPNE